MFSGLLYGAPYQAPGTGPWPLPTGGIYLPVPESSQRFVLPPEPVPASSPALELVALRDVLVALDEAINKGQTGNEQFRDAVRAILRRT